MSFKLTGIAMASVEALMTFAALVTDTGSIPALANGTLPASDLAVIAIEATRTAAHIVANTPSGVHAGNHALG